MPVIHTTANGNFAKVRLPAEVVGPTGPEGPVGALGPPGATGAQGSTGVQGLQGAQGSTGVVGPQGITGTQGLQGPQGEAGVTGTPGITGPQGPQGSQGNQGTTGTQGITGSQGAQGAAGPAGTTGSQGITGAQGPQGSVGPAGVTGSPGITGSQGPQGTAGPTGVTGTQGVTGVQGTQGTQGPQGATGPTGSQGSQGITGVQGPQGSIGPQGATGSQGITGVQGSQGAQGLPGNTGITGATGVGGPQGPQGSTGLQGVQGAQGVTGVTGSQGSQGSTGVRGTTGSQGPTGSQGVQGIQGTTGLQGAQGAQGITGTTGVQGPQGNTGVQGVQGITGTTGAQGLRGITGVQGIQGITGTTGVQGPRGNTGVQGVQGITGTTGVQGPQGITGTQGLQGPQGRTGTQGPQGITGTQGAQGPVGVTGAQGPQGVQGVQGPQGLTGMQGPQGVQGPLGDTGTAGPQGPTGLLGDSLANHVQLVTGGWLRSGDDTNGLIFGYLTGVWATGMLTGVSQALVGRGADAIQVWINPADGKLYAGSGKIILDSSYITLITEADAYPTSGYQLTDTNSSTGVFGALTGWSDTVSRNAIVHAWSTNYNPVAGVRATTPYNSGKTATAMLSADTSGLGGLGRVSVTAKGELANINLNAGTGGHVVAEPDLKAATAATAVGAEVFTNGDLTSGTGWSCTGDMVLTVDTAVYTHSTGEGTLTQAVATQPNHGLSKRTYDFTYTISAAPTIAGVAYITTTFADVITYLNLIAGTHVTRVEAAAAPGDFVIRVVSTSGSFTLDALSLKLVTVGDMVAAGDLLGTNLQYAGDLKPWRNNTLLLGSTFVPLTAPLTSASWDGDAYSTTSKTAIDLSAVFGAPAGIKAVLIFAAVRDSGSAATDCWLVLGSTNTAYYGPTINCQAVNDRFGRDTMVVPCDASGDIYYQIAASGPSTFDAYIQIWGYWV
jgi:hypothetical protein